MRYVLIYFFTACAYTTAPDCGPTIKAWATTQAECVQAAQILYKRGLTPEWMCASMSSEMIDFTKQLEFQNYDD